MFRKLMPFIIGGLIILQIISAFILSTPFMAVIGCLAILMSAIKWEIKGGIYSASLCSVIVLAGHILAVLQSSEWSSIIITILLYYAVGVGAGGVIGTARKQRLSLILSEKKFSSYIENAPDGVFVTDETGHYLEVNRAASLITGYSKEELLQMSIGDLIPIEFQEDGMNHFKKLLETGSSRGAMQYKHKSGSVRWWSVEAVKISDHRFLGFAKDITDQKNTEDKILYLSYHDQLTGLYNRRFFEEELKRLDTRRNFPLTIVMGDVNGLKAINDAVGHDKGDELLRKSAEVIKKGCRADDIVARLGGDEFVIILSDTDVLKAEQIIERINELSLKEKVGNINISISFGYKTKNNENEKIQDIFKQAEDNMYANKRSRRRE